MKIRYESNDSGGRWWLDDAQWKALEAAGWVVEWRRERFLGAKATAATLKAESIADAVRSFECATREDADALGCECCGQPHCFSEVRS